MDGPPINAAQIQNQNQISAAGKAGFIPGTSTPLSSSSPNASTLVPPPVVVTSGQANAQINGIRDFANQQAQAVDQHAQVKATNQEQSKQQQQAYYDANPYDLRPGETTNAQKTGTYDLRIAPLQKAGASDYASGTAPKAQFYFTRNPDGSIIWKDANGITLPTNPISGDQGNAQAPETLPQFQNGQIASYNPNNPPWSSQPAVGGATGTDVAGGYNSAVQNNANAFTQSTADIQTQRDKQQTDIQNKIIQIENGTFPLTTSQQAMLDSTKAQFQQLINQQKIANDTYQQGMLVFEARSGEAQGGTTTAMGNYQNAVNTGLAKIGDIENKMSTALATMQSGFMSEDLKMVQTAYDDFTKYADSKQNAVKDIADATSNALKDMRDVTMKALQDNITNAMNSDKFTYQQKQDKIANDLAQSGLDEKKRSALVNEMQAQEKINLQKKANELAQGIYDKMTPIPSTSNGTPDPVAQQKFLDQFSPVVQTQIKGLADYSVNPADFSTSARQSQGGLTKSQAVALAKTYDSTYDDKEYSSRQKFLTNWKAGGQNSVIQAANTSIDHLTKLWGEAQNLGNIDSGTLGPFTSKYNTVTQWLNEGSQNKSLYKFKQDALALAGEQARIYKNGTGSNAAPGEDEIRNQLEILTTGLSPDNAKSLIENGINLFTDRLTSSVENYRSVMGKQPESILYPTAMDNIKKLKDEGFNLDVSKLNPSPYNGVSNTDFYNSLNNATGSVSNQSNSDFFNSIIQMNAQNANNL